LGLGWFVESIWKRRMLLMETDKTMKYVLPKLDEFALSLYDLLHESHKKEMTFEVYRDRIKRILGEKGERA